MATPNRSTLPTDRPPHAPEGREAARRNLFIAAALEVAGAVHSVKIRDLSAAGARIETSLAPLTGSAVVLVRGDLCAEARVGWTTAQSCGLRFVAPVSVADWMASPALLAARRAAGAVPDSAPGAAGASPASVEQAAGRLAQIIARLVQVQVNLGRDLALLGQSGSDLREVHLALRGLAECADSLRLSLSGRQPPRAPLER